MSDHDSARRRAFDTLLWLAVAHALVTAALRLPAAFNALVLVPDAAIDLHIRYDEVRRWFAGFPIYGDAHSANYPPGSYALLWPLLGWLPEPAARWLYAASVVTALAVAGLVAVRAGGATRAPEKAFLLVFLLPLGATQITVWIGQLGLHVTAALLLATLLLFGSAPHAAGGYAHRDAAASADAPGRDIAAAALLAFALVKPTLSVPVVIAILLVTWRWRPALLTTAVYAIATLAAAAAQRASPVTLLVQWLGREEIMNLPLGSVNSYLWLHWLGVEGSMLPASLVFVAALVAWTWHRRHSPPWLLIGVAALVARIWIHHRAFDDVIIVIAAIALFRVAKLADVERRARTMAAALVVAIYSLGHAPYAYLSGEHRPLWIVTEAGRTAVWLVALIFLVWTVMRARSPGISEADPAAASLR